MVNFTYANIMLCLFSSEPMYGPCKSYSEKVVVRMATLLWCIMNITGQEVQFEICLPIKRN